MCYFDSPTPSGVHRASVPSRHANEIDALFRDTSDTHAVAQQVSRSDVIEASISQHEGVSPAWTESEIIQLQFILLDECRALANPVYPLSEKLDILRWIFAEDGQAFAPFSFYRCVRSAFGSCDVTVLRAALWENVHVWFDQTLDQCPMEVRGWLQEVLRKDPTWLADRLESNPQFINETARALKRQPDFFADCL